jgi:glycosyltransferase involved in cell wall biosynthesis
VRVLIVTPTPTHPGTQGNRVRAAQVAGAFKRAGAWVDLVCYALDGVDRAALEAMGRAWDSVALVDLRGFVPRRSRPDCWGLDDWVSPSLMECVRAFADAARYDVVVVNYVWCSAVLECFPPAPEGPLRIIDTHDAFGRRLRLMRAAGLAPHWYYTTEAEEGAGLDRADLVLAIQEDEARYFAGVTRRRVLTVEFARPPSPVPAAPAPGRLRVGYIGSANPWNVRSLLALDRELEARRGAFPGGRPPRVAAYGAVAEAVGDARHILALGPVSEAEDAYARVDLMLNPMVGGTGLKIKTVEAISYGRPILSTLAGGIGLEWLHPDLAHRDVPALVRRLAWLASAPEEVVAIGAAMREAYGAFHRDVARKTQALVAMAAGGVAWRGS